MRNLNLRQRYDEDFAHVRGPAAWLAVAAGSLLLILFPFVAPGYVIFTAVLVGVNALVAVGLTLLTGYAGQISLGHAGFVAVGAVHGGPLGRAARRSMVEIIIWRNASDLDQPLLPERRPAERLRQNPHVQELYLGITAAPSVKGYRRYRLRRRWT